MRRRVERIGALVVLAAMVCSLTACGSKPAESSPGTTGAKGRRQRRQGNRREAPEKMRYVAPGSDWEKEDEIIGLVNDKLQKDGVNIEVELIRIPWDAWDQKVNLMLSTGEEFELLCMSCRTERAQRYCVPRMQSRRLTTIWTISRI